MEYSADPMMNPSTTQTTTPWRAPVTRPATSYQRPPAPAVTPAVPVLPRVATGQYNPDPAAIIRGFAKEVVDNRYIDMNGEQVETLVLILETSPGHVVPVQAWGQKKCDFVKANLNRPVDVVFTVGCQVRQVPSKDTGEMLTIYNASLKLKSLLTV